jgi:hypothetical protein
MPDITFYQEQSQGKKRQRDEKISAATNTHKTNSNHNLYES